MSTRRLNVFLVDDDPLFLRSLEIEFIENADFDVETFNSGESCVKRLSDFPDVIVLDYHLNGINKNAMNGIETLDQIKLHSRKVPVIMLSSQDKIDVAINCMHHRATDYVVKSETAFIRLHQIITNIHNYKKMENELNWYMERM
jgi:two-component system, OmpR family, response regulator